MRRYVLDTKAEANLLLEFYAQMSQRNGVISHALAPFNPDVDHLGNGVQTQWMIVAALFVRITDG